MVHANDQATLGSCSNEWHRTARWQHSTDADGDCSRSDDVHQLGDDADVGAVARIENQR